MILDAQGQISDSQTTTTGAGANLGDNVVDLGSDRSLGTGEPMAVLFNIETAAVQTGSDEDYTFDIEYATNAAQTTGLQMISRRLFESGTPGANAQDADLLVAGFQFAILLPPTDPSEGERYFGVRVTQVGAAAAVVYSAHLVPVSSIPKSIAYPKGYVIS